MAPVPIAMNLLTRLRRTYGRLRFSPFLCQVVVTRRCNLACGYCAEYDHVSAPVPTDELRRRVDAIAGLGSFGLEFTGGEPLLHPGLPALVAHARPCRFRMLGVITNGFLLDARTIESFNEAGLTDLQVSVDRVKPGAVTSKALEPLRPRLEALAARARFRVVLSAVVGAGARLSEVADVIRAAREHGFRPRILLVHGPDGQLALGQEDRLAFADAQRLIGWHWRDAFDYRTRLLQHGLAPFRCRAGSRYLYVDEGGLAHWCAQTMAAFGKPLASYDHDDLRRQFHTPKPCNAACTLGCARSCSSFDRWFAES